MKIHSKFIKKVKIFIILTAVLAMATQSVSGQTSVEGNVIKISDNKVTIETSMADTIPEGSRVDIFFKISEDQSMSIGQWKVSSAGNGRVFATPVDVLGPPQEGMTAKISFSEGKKQVQVLRQNHHNAPPISQNSDTQSTQTKFGSIEPQLRGKEPKKQLLGIPFPEKSAQDYVEQGNAYYYGKNYKMAIKEYEQCARMGNSECQRMLGLFYNNGFGVEIDLNKSRQFYEESALQNNVRAIYNLGVIYLKGQGVKKDITKARELFLQSADMGYPEAQFNLGALYYNGIGVEKNETTALKWIKKAADQNTPEAIYFVGQAHEFGLGTPKDISKANEYYKKAADLGDKNAKKKVAQWGGENKLKINKKFENLESETQKMFEALYVNDLKTVKEQLKKGVSANAKNDVGQTPLHVAQDLAILKLLISSGADVNRSDGDGRTPIFNKEIELLKVLIEAGADIHHRSNNKTTLLMWYSYSGYLEGIQYIASLGADVNAVNMDGQTAHDIAEKFAHFKLLEYLISIGAQPGK